MKKTMELSDFRTEFARQERNEFSYEGLEVLFHILTEFEEVGEEIELDVTAICCDFAEGVIEDVLEEYGLETIEELEDATIVRNIDDNTVIYQLF